MKSSLFLICSPEYASDSVFSLRKRGQTDAVHSLMLIVMSMSVL